MSSVTYKINVQPEAERQFQSLPANVRSFVYENVTTWAELEAPRVRPEDVTPKSKLIYITGQGKSAYGISGVFVETDHHNLKITIIKLVL